MNITILDNRDVIINSSDNLGTQNENNASIINFSFPESLMNANKKIVFITDDGNYWDLITNNSYKITNAVSKYKNVSVYVWLVDEQNDIDFRSKIWNVSFNKNEEPDDIVPTEEEISGFDTMITQLNQGLEELDEEKIKLRREYEKVEEGLEDLDEALIQVNNVDIDVSKSQTTTTVTITNKEGTEKSVQIEDGTDYVITPEDYQTIANVVETDITPLIPTKTSDLDNDSGFIDNTVNNLTNYYDKTTSDGKYALITETGYRVELSVDSSTYVMTLNLKNKSGNILNTQTVDLPLETMVVNASYDSLTKEIVLTLQNGNTIRFSVADLVSGLQTEITSNNKLASDLVDDTNQTNKFVTTTEKTTWNAKYDKPSGGIPSTDLSSAVQTSLGKADTAVQDVSGKEDESNKVTSINENSTDTQYPSAKLLYDQLAEKQEQIDALVEENSTLKKQIPTEHISTTSTQLTDSAEDLEIENVVIKGAMSQVTDEYVYMCDGTETGDYYFVHNNTNYQFTMPTISEGDALVFDGTKLTLDGTEITTTTDNTGTLITLQPAPNPAYPQEIHCVTGTNNVITQNKNLFKPTNTNNGTTIIRFGATVSLNDDEFTFVATAADMGFGNVILTGNSYSNAFGILIPVEPNQIIRAKLTNTDLNRIYMTFYNENKISLGYQSIFSNEGNITAPVNAKYMSLRFGKNNAVAGTTYKTKVMLTIDSEITDYVKHQEQNAPLSLGNIELYEGDKIQISYINKAGYKKITGASITRKYLEYSFTGNETISLQGNSNGYYAFKFALENSKAGRVQNQYISNMFKQKATASWDAEGIINVSLTERSDVYIFVSENTATTVSEFKTKLSNWYANGTPMYIVYQLNELNTTPITDPTLLSQLETLINMKTYKQITNIDTTGSDLAPVLEFQYSKDLQTVTDTLLNVKVDKSSFVYDSNTETLTITIS